MATDKLVRVGQSVVEIDRLFAATYRPSNGNTEGSVQLTFDNGVEITIPA